MPLTLRDKMSLSSLRLLDSKARFVRSPPRPYACHLCSFAAATTHDLDAHLVNHPEQQFLDELESDKAAPRVSAIVPQQQVETVAMEVEVTSAIQPVPSQPVLVQPVPVQTVPVQTVPSQPVLIQPLPPLEPQRPSVIVSGEDLCKRPGHSYSSLIAMALRDLGGYGTLQQLYKVRISSCNLGLLINKFLRAGGAELKLPSNMGKPGDFQVTTGSGGDVDNLTF